jgi:dolichyl-phosphate-mannose-protein mannosyltransferase
MKKPVFWIFIFIFAYVNYVHRYWQPIENVWDEIYFIPSAAKYTKGVYFMEAHPPLGKLLIAAGEVLLRPLTGQYDSFGLENVEEGSSQVTIGYTSLGYRFFPVVFAVLNAVLFALILLEIFKDRFYALLFSCLYLFENSYISIGRIAILDTFLISGVLLSILSFLKLLQLNPKKGSTRELWINSLIMALGFSIAILTKAFGYILILLWPLLFYFNRSLLDRKYSFKILLAQFLLVFTLFNAVWYTHFKLGEHVNPNGPNQGLYFASEDLKKVLLNEPHNFNGLESYLLNLRDNVLMGFSFSKTVPPYSLAKGSLSASFPITWPLGSRPIHLRSNPDAQGLKSLMVMIPNPVNWLFALIGLILLPGIFFLQKVMRVRFFKDFHSSAIISLGSIYLIFMIGLSMVRRMLYMHHYLTPLMISFILFAFFWKSLLDHWTGAKQQRRLKFLSIAMAAMSVLSFCFFKPITYGDDMTCTDMNKRFFIRFWDLSHMACPHPAAAEPGPEWDKPKNL